tara:strand:- start:5575 stop:6054 length:480 start_codon:yes stop_codon:yes gene_type:complete
MASPLSATRTASTSQITAAKSSITQKGSGNYKSNPVSSFFTTLVSDVKQGFTGPEARNYGSGYEYKTPREKRYDAQRENEAYYANLNDDKPRRAAPSRAVPVYVAKTTEQFYNELKVDFGPLPSLRSETASSYSKPVYNDIGLIQREGGEVRSLFNPYG